jgi:hypothetical protein
MTRPKRDALWKVHEAIARWGMARYRRYEDAVPLYAKVRRALNALLRERAEAAVNDARSSKMRLRESTEYWAAFEETIRAAVLGRKPK